MEESFRLDTEHVRAITSTNGTAVAICMLTLPREDRRITELRNLSGKYIAAGARVYWITLDALTEKTEFALPPGVRWLRLCEPGLRTGGIRASIAIATKLAPVLNYINPTEIIPFQRASRHALRLARLATGNSAPAWIWLALRLVSPRRYARLRGESAANEAALADIFDPDWYREQYQIDGRADSLVGYFLSVGQYLGHSPHPLFWASWYSHQCVQPGTPLGHFFSMGAAEDRNPNPFFVTKWYKSQAGLPASAEDNPLAHYLYSSNAAALDPNPLFDHAWYVASYKVGKRSSLEHFVCDGARLPCSPFLARHPEICPSGGYRSAFEKSFAFGPSPMPPWQPTTDQAKYALTPPRVAFCTVATGDYDTFEPLGYCQPNADYFFLTDRPSADIDTSGWRVIHVARNGQVSPIILSREIKMNLTRFIPNIEQYAAVVYLDGNVNPVGDLSRMTDHFLRSDAELGVIPHPFRQTVYMEAAAVMLQDRDTRENVLKAVQLLEAEQCPAEAGLFEMNLFVFRPGKASKRFFDAWWRLYQEYGRRDQLLAPLVAWKIGTKLHALMPSGQSVRNHPALAHRDHRK